MGLTSVCWGEFRTLWSKTRDFSSQWFSKLFSFCVFITLCQLFHEGNMRHTWISFLSLPSMFFITTTAGCWQPGLVKNAQVNGKIIELLIVCGYGRQSINKPGFSTPTNMLKRTPNRFFLPLLEFTTFFLGRFWPRNHHSSFGRVGKTAAVRCWHFLIPEGTALKMTGAISGTNNTV